MPAHRAGAARAAGAQPWAGQIACHARDPDQPARPAEAGDRAVPGNREGDLILGLGSSGIGTLVERTTRFTLLLHLPRMAGHGVGAREKNCPALAGHGAEAVRDAITRTIATLPGVLRRSLTWDQGAEMAGHPRLRIDTGLQVYFCDPHSPWQRGTNENTNGLLMGSAGT
jgi:IS30 family transposase